MYLVTLKRDAKNKRSNLYPNFYSSQNMSTTISFGILSNFTSEDGILTEFKEIGSYFSYPYWNHRYRLKYQ